VKRAVLLILVLCPSALAGQAPRLAFFGGGGAVRVHETVGRRTQVFNTALPTGEAVLSIGPVVFEGYYGQGHLDPVAGSTVGRDLVEGAVYAGLRFAQRFMLSGGTRARSYVQPGGTRRHIAVLGRGTFETPVAGSVATARIDVWAALMGRTNLDERFDNARGGEAALTLHFPDSPLWARLGYRVEHTRFDSGGREETVEGLRFMVGLGAS
jgi:hypothetical protein